ncbi:hypothetical protein [Bdellovibrio sp. BCCA]|uniref:hypothetical protein n=1 Tax=Bdellovibrio sp. BCCA TaxID=3136281 RepID=UPI0030F01964
MIRVLTSLKNQLIKFYNIIKELDQMPMRRLQGEFYEEERKEPRVRRKNDVKVEDLFPKKSED